LVTPLFGLFAVFVLFLSSLFECCPLVT
jgi:hypothetical protein